jgi:hypothetical protein
MAPKQRVERGARNERDLFTQQFNGGLLTEGTGFNSWKRHAPPVPGCQLWALRLSTADLSLNARDSWMITRYSSMIARHRAVLISLVHAIHTSLACDAKR